MSEALNTLACLRISEGGSREGRGKVRGRITGSIKISQGKNVKRKELTQGLVLKLRSGDTAKMI